MFDPGSRYLGLAIATVVVADTDGTGREIRYVRRRLIPGERGMVTLLEHRVVQGDRLDNIAARTLGDPLLYWRICDANRAARPGDLTATSGRALRIAIYLE